MLDHTKEDEDSDTVDSESSDDTSMYSAIGPNKVYSAVFLCIFPHIEILFRFPEV